MRTTWARHRDVQPIAGQQERHPARSVGGRRRRHRHEDERRLTSLELVDGSDEDIGESCGREILPEPCNLRVEGSDDEDVGLVERPGAGDSRSDRSRLGREVPGSGRRSPRIPRGNRSICRRARRSRRALRGRGPRGRSRGRHRLLRVEPALVRQLGDPLAQRGMHAPRPFEEVATVAGQRIAARGEPTQCGLVDRLRMGALATCGSCCGSREGAD